MNKVIILSVQPQWLVKILNGEKTIEIRKSMPKCELPIDVYIYCTKGRGNDKSPVLCSMSDLDCDEKTQEFIKKDTEYGLNVWKQLVPAFSILDGKIVAKFTLNKVERFDVPYPAWFYEIKERLQNITVGSRLSLMSLHRYLRNDSGYAWHIDNLEIFGKPMELKEFYRNNFDEDEAKPCNCGKYCKYEGYDMQENCRICTIDYDGSSCPFLKVQRPPMSWCYAYKE